MEMESPNQEQQVNPVTDTEKMLVNAMMLGAFCSHLSHNLDEIAQLGSDLINEEYLEDLQLRDVMVNILDVVKPEGGPAFLRLMLDHFIHDPQAVKVMDYTQECLDEECLLKATETFHQLMYRRLLEVQSQVEMQN